MVSMAAVPWLIFDCTLTTLSTLIAHLIDTRTL